MKATFLDFEQPIAELEAKIEELRFVQDDSAVDISQEIQSLQKRSQALTKDIYSKKGGALDFIVQDTKATNQAGVLCCEMRFTVVVRNEPAS